MILPEPYLPSDLPGLVRQLSALWRALQVALVKVDGGTYTPTTTNTTNATTSTPFSGQWSRAGDTVTIGLRVNVAATAAGAVAVGVSLPVASNLGACNDCAGAGTAVNGTTYLPVAVSGDPTAGGAVLNFVAGAAVTYQVWVSFSYRIA